MNIGTKNKLTFIIYNGPGVKHCIQHLNGVDINSNKLLKLNIQSPYGDEKKVYFKIISIQKIDLLFGHLFAIVLDQQGNHYKIFYNACDKSGYLNKL